MNHKSSMTCRSRWYSATGSCFRRPAPPARLGDETRMMLCDNYCNYYYIYIMLYLYYSYHSLGAAGDAGRRDPDDALRQLL